MVRSRTSRFVAVSAGALVLLVASGCAPSTPVASDADTDDPEAVATAAPAEPTGVETGASPISERDAARQRAFEEAIAGLAFEDGLIRVAAAGRSDRDAALGHVAEGDAFMSTNQRTEAIKAYAAAVRSVPDDADHYVRLGDAFITKGKTEMAAAAYRTATTLEPSGLEAHVELANTLARDQQMTEAIATMNAVLEIDPDHAIAHDRLAVWHYYAGDYAEAWRHVHAQRRLGHDGTPQLVALLETQMSDPAIRADTP